MKNIITVVEAKAMTAEALTSGIVTRFESGRVAYLEAAIMLIALTAVLGSSAKAQAAVKKAGAKPGDLKNAAYLVSVYDALVVPGYVSEDWFADVRYMDAWHITRALSKVTAKKLAAEGVFKGSVPGSVTKCELVVETGMSPSEQKAAADKKADKEAAASAVTPAVEPAVTEGDEVPESLTEAPAVAPVENGKSLTELSVKGPSNGMAEFEDRMATIEQIAVLLVAKSDEVTIGRIQARIVALNVAVSTAIEAVAAKPKAKKSA